VEFAPGGPRFGAHDRRRRVPRRLVAQNDAWARRRPRLPRIGLRAVPDMTFEVVTEPGSIEASRLVSPRLRLNAFTSTSARSRSGSGSDTTANSTYGGLGARPVHASRQGYSPAASNFGARAADNQRRDRSHPQARGGSAMHATKRSAPLPYPAVSSGTPDARRLSAISRTR
jgi:hypothetical protein